MQGDIVEVTTRAERRRQIEQGARRTARPSGRSRRTRGPHRSLESVVAAPDATELLLVEDKASRTGRRAADRALRGRRRRRTVGSLVAAAALVIGGLAGAAWGGLLPDDVRNAALQVVGADPSRSAADDTVGTAAEPVAAPVSAPSAATPSVSLTESADERLLSTVDQCRAMSRGELDVASAAYRALVVSAGAADLDAWCADLTGDAARTDS